ncbi:hypothetical protein JVT61DRAFT_8034 [Boletus reticuloceps]|uniref:Uncharacterized protein n=1 Tax=Boletus reticuloceps TaxID=495285 RepID=A0A8I2YH97_9AGAM|nr:hypothetical protein JVT61DRAFT_8034 [Boletus reticuloceps]
MLEGVEEMQYYRTFEADFNSVMNSKIEQTDETIYQSAQEWNKVPAERLKNILEKLKKVDPTRLREVHQRLLVPFTALSSPASILRFKQVIKDAAINPWISAAFKEAVGNADESGKSWWLFASCLIQLATNVDAFSPIEGQVENSLRNAVGCEKTPSMPPRMDSVTLLSYVFNTEAPATPEQVVYALQIMLSNVDEHSMLASNPNFVNYILYSTGPGQVYSVRDTGLNVLVAICQSLLRTYDTVSLVRLAADCGFVHFLHRAILHQDPPTMLKDFLRSNDEGFNETLLGILAPALGDPFNALLTKLNDESNEISDRHLRNLEIALVLSNSEGRQRLFFDHLDHCISQIPHWDYQYAMALPLTVIVGWLLRRDRPLGSSESVWKVFLRPDFELLLFSAWGDPDALEDNPHMLRMLLDCTARWLSMYANPGTGVSSRPPLDATLARLQHSLDQLRSGNRALSWDIKRTLQRLSREIRQHGQA